MIGGGIALVVGAFLPWIKGIAPFVGTISKSGTDGGGDGWFVLGAGIVAVVFGVMVLKDSRPAAPCGIVLGLAATALMIYEYSDVQDRVESIRSLDIAVTADYGAGLILCIVGAVAVVVASFIAATGKTTEAPDNAPEHVIGGFSTT